MGTETFKYFQPDTANLKAAYGGAAIQDGGDSGEIPAQCFTERYILKLLGEQNLKFSHLCRYGQVGSDWWLKVSDNLYPAISALFAAHPSDFTTEAASVVSAAPVGFSNRSLQNPFAPDPNKITIIFEGDSITDGLGTTAGDTRDTFIGQAFALMGEVITYTDTEYKQGYSEKYAIGNIAIGASSWDNLNALGGQAGYPHRQALKYNQRIKTMPLNNRKTIFFYWLGTNDLAYDSGVIGADVYARAVRQIAQLRADFPHLVIIVCTVIKRNGDADFGLGYNTLLRANYQSIGANVLCDFDATVGDWDDLIYTTDGTHPNNAGHALMAPTFRAALEQAEALLPSTAFPAPTFTPAALPSVQAWLDGSDAAAVTQTGGVVSHLRDKSGKLNHFSQATVANRPETGVRTVNGLNVITARSGAKQLTATPFTALAAYAVVNLVSTEDSDLTILMAESDQSPEFFVRHSTSSFGDVSFDGTASGSGKYSLNGGPFSGFAANHLTPNAPMSGPIIICGVLSAAIQVNHILNRLSQASGSFGSDICELILTDAELSTADFNNLMTYFSNKWGIALL